MRACERMRTPPPWHHARTSQFIVSAIFRPLLTQQRPRYPSQRKGFSVSFSPGCRARGQPGSPCCTADCIRLIYLVMACLSELSSHSPSIQRQEGLARARGVPAPAQGGGRKS